MSVRQRIRCSVCNKDVKKVGQKLMSHKCSEELGEGEKTSVSSSIHSDSEIQSQKCTVFKCSLCKKDVVKVGRNLMGHKCLMVLRNGLGETPSSTTHTIVKNKDLNHLVSDRKRFRCSLCNKDLKRVGQKFVGHECSKLVYLPKSSKEKCKERDSFVFRTYVKCHLCNELVEKVGQVYKNHKCSKSTDLQPSEEQVEKPPIIHKNSKDVNQSRINVEVKCLLCDGEVRNGRQGISCHHLPKKKDQNLENEFKHTNQSTKHFDSFINVDCWVKDHMDKGVVRFYKPKGSFLHSHPDLSENDLIIMILNEAQCETLKQYGSDCVCIDATVGMKDDFELVTLMVLDTHGQAIPCSFMLTNRVDSRTMEILFNVIKTVVGCSIGTSILMTNTSSVFWIAWNVVMRFVPLNWLYSSWQVEAAWKKNLSLIQSEDKRTAVHKTLMTVLQEKDETTFTQLLGTALEEWGLDQDTVEFSSYFITEFSHNVTNWAYCYRKNLGEDKNLFLERMHMVLKSIQHLGNQSGSLEKFIPSLMRFIEDKIHDEKSEQTEDKMLKKMSSIIARQHQAARRMKKVQVTKTNEGWSLSGNNGIVNHKVVVNNLSCDCKLKCDSCKICIHNYNCSCESNFTICPHIHYLAINEFLYVLIRPSVEPTTSGDTINSALSQDLGVDCFDLLEESLEPSINSMSALETDDSANSYLDLQSTSMKRSHDQDDHHQVVDELENRKRKLRLELQQILDNVKTLKDAHILETLLKPILPTLVASHLATSVVAAAQTSGNKTISSTSRK